MTDVAGGLRRSATPLLELGGLIAAVFLAAIVNILAARHYTRWDWTRDKRWSLSPATAETLEEPVRFKPVPLLA